MNMRRLYLAAGIIWGGILGFISALYVGGGVAGIFWIFIFGDNVWPEWAQGVISAIAVLVGLLVFGSCVLISWFYSRQVVAKKFDHKKEFRRAAVLIILSFVVISGYVFLEDRWADKELLRSQARQAEQKKRLEDTSPRRKTGESDVAYYCRVISKHSKIEFIYRGHLIRIVPVLLQSEKLLFAVVAPYDIVKELAREVIISEEIISGNKTLVSDFVALPADIVCGKRMFFIQSDTNYLSSSLNSMRRVHCSIPSANLGFTMNVRKGNAANTYKASLCPRKASNGPPVK